MDINKTNKPKKKYDNTVSINKEINICQWNVRSLAKNPGAFRQLFRKYNITTTLLSETFLNSNTIKDIKIKDFNITSYSTRDNHPYYKKLNIKQGGGTCILINQNLKTEKLKQSIFNNVNIGPIEVSAATVFFPIDTSIYNKSATSQITNTHNNTNNISKNNNNNDQQNTNNKQTNQNNDKDVHPENPLEPILLASIYIPPNQPLKYEHLDNLMTKLKTIAKNNTIIIGGGL